MCVCFDVCSGTDNATGASILYHAIQGKDERRVYWEVYQGLSGSLKKILQVEIKEINNDID